MEDELAYFLSYLLFFLGLIFMCGLAYAGKFVEFRLQWFFPFSLFPLLFYGAFNLFNEYGRHVFKLTLNRRYVAMLIALAIFMLILIYLCIPNTIQDIFGVTSAGHVVHSRSWFESNGKYFEVINGGIPYEIKKEEYDRLELQLAKIFSMFIVVFSYVSIVMFTMLKFRNGSHCDGVK
jgi:hypothetical protein